MLLLQKKEWISTPTHLKTTLDQPISMDYMNLFKKLLGHGDDVTKAEGVPRCILLVGARAAGKTTITKCLQQYLPKIDIQKFGLFDGDILRANYEPLRDISAETSNVRYSDAWSIVKRHMDQARFDILYNHIIPEKRNLILAAGEKSSYYYDLFTGHGYEMIVVGISVNNWDEVLLRGTNRAELTGRPYSGTREMWEECERCIDSLSKRAETIESVIIDNSNCMAPKVISRTCR